MASTHNHDHGTDHGEFARKAARAVGAVFLLVGILGFIPGITTDYDTMKFAGHESDAALLGIFEVSILHNIVHLLFGAAGIALSKNGKSAVNYLIGGGAIYLVLFVYGLLVDHDSSANFVPLNSADNLLHLVLGIAMIALGLIGKKKMETDHAGTGHTGTGTGTGTGAQI